MTTVIKCKQYQMLINDNNTQSYKNINFTKIPPKLSVPTNQNNKPLDLPLPKYLQGKKTIIYSRSNQQFY